MITHKLLPQAFATSFCHKLLSQASVTSFCHKLLPQATVTSFCHKLRAKGTVTSFSHKLLSQASATSLSQASATSFSHKLLSQASPTSYCHKLLPQAEGNPLMGTEGSQASNCWPLQPLGIDRASESSHTVTKVSKLLYLYVCSTYNQVQRWTSLMKLKSPKCMNYGPLTHKELCCIQLSVPDWRSKEACSFGGQ